MEKKKTQEKQAAKTTRERQEESLILFQGSQQCKNKHCQNKTKQKLWNQQNQEGRKKKQAFRFSEDRAFLPGSPLVDLLLSLLFHGFANKLRHWGSSCCKYLQISFKALLLKNQASKELNWELERRPGGNEEKSPNT